MRGVGMRGRFATFGQALKCRVSTRVHRGAPRNRLLDHVVLFCLLMALISGCSDRRKTDLARISAAADERADRDHFQVF